MNIIESIRKQVICDLFSTTTMNNCWQIWQPLILTRLGRNYTPQNILDLGDYLSEIFKSTGGEGRGQGELSGGGNAWEALVTWYINLCCVGTRVVAVKKMGQVPTPIKDSITVNYANFACSTESDITIIEFPTEIQYLAEDEHFLDRNGKVNLVQLSDAINQNFNLFNIGIVQCKTNWNDNAQIPMLWDMIYSAGGFRNRQISVGRNNFSIQNLRTFTYSFVTVPTNKIESFKTSSVSVRRVRGLSGGNYWGKQTSNGIARSVKEIFNNYSTGFENNNIRTT